MSQTNAQKMAADPKVSARVSANAGTGKTHILVNRFLRLLLAGAHPNRILCLTYTKAAAAEMSERITKKLKAWVMMDAGNLGGDLHALLDRPASENELLRARQLFTIKLQSMPPPRIQTIHSFCQEILSQFTLESGLSQGFKVVDELTAADFLSNAKKFLLSKSQYDKRFSEAVQYLAKNSSEFKFDAILNEVISNRNKFRKLIDEFSDEESAIENIYNKLNIKRGISQEFFSVEIANFDHEMITKYLMTLENSHGKRDQDTAYNLRVMMESFDERKYAKIFLKEGNLPKTLSYLISKKALSEAPELEEFLLAEQDRLFQLVDKINSLKIAEFTEKATVIIYGFMTIYEDIKHKNNALDYEDLIYYTLKLLDKSDSAAWILYKLDGGVEHILVDEAQDTSPEQWQIVSHLADDFFSGDGSSEKDRTIFIVGDEKQSIYSFQGAEPRAFGEIASQFGVKAVQAKHNWLEIPLNKSFRSVSAVLKLVDSVFADEVLRSAASFNQQKIEHDVYRVGQGGVVELWPLEEQKEKEKIGAWEPPITIYEGSDVETELAKKIAKTIRTWFAQQRHLKATGREVQPQDIMILLRKRGGFADKLICELKKQNIPVAGSDRLSVTENIAIMDMIALGNFLLLPKDDYSLACALKSPLFGVSEDELFEISQGRGELSILENLLDNSDLMEKLNVLLGVSKEMSPFELYSYILDNLDGRKKFIARLGDEVNDPINEFLELCLEFENSHNSSLQEFLYWLNSEEILIKRDMEQGQNKVRVMTIHASKGLQAPVVFLPDTVSTPSGDAKTGNNIIWEEGAFYALSTSKNSNQHLKNIAEARKRKDEEEYARLLYVALTRASDELYIAGVEKQTRLPANCWYNILRENMEKIAKKEGDILRYETAQTKQIEQEEALLVQRELEDIPAFYYDAFQALT